MAYQSDPAPGAYAHDYETEISFLNDLIRRLDAREPTYAAKKAQYEREIENLYQQQWGGQASGSNDNGFSPAGDSTASSSLSRKRSLASMGDFDLSDPKRVGLDGSPAMTPGTPMSLNLPDPISPGAGLAGQSNSSNNEGGRLRNLQGLQSAIQGQSPRHVAMAMRPHQAGGGHAHPWLPQTTPMVKPQSGFVGPLNAQHFVKSEPQDYTNALQFTPMGGDGDYMDLRNLEDDPFPELAYAYQSDNQRPSPNDAFGQEWMSEEALAQFLIAPTPPNGGYAFGAGRQNAGPVPPPFGGGLARQPIQQRDISLEEELFGDFEDTEDSLPSAEVTPEALTKLFENIKPDDEIPPELREQTPSAMSSQLMEHQKLGLTWLKKMEEGNAKGGILADEMGLGKTVQALALILARPSNDPICKTTLIIAPVALMRQWEKELQRHVKPTHKLKTYRYHGYGKNADFNKLRQFDVVLTTFGTLGSELKQMEKRKEAELVLREQRDPNFKRNVKDKLALIGPECLWYRVIIDEAQCIKNRSTQVSKASNELQARHRLAMTGTPMMNSVDELYPLIRFLRIKPYNDWFKFSFDISKPFKDSRHDWKTQRVIGRLQALLKSIMLRREKTSVVDGQQICTIPPKHTKHQNVEFSDEEHNLYKAIETNSQLKFNKYLEKGTVNNNYANVLVLLLRLRQACCHPHLIKDLGVQVSTEGIAEDDLLSRAESLNEDVVNRLKEAESFECPICFEADLNPTIIIPCGHTCCGECFQKLIDPAQAIREGNEDGSGVRCPHCRGVLSSNRITDYKHFRKVFCPERVDPSELPGDDKDSDSDDDSEDEETDDDDLQGFVVPDDADDDYEPPPHSGEAELKVQPKKSKGKARAKPKETLAQLKKASLRNKEAKKKYIRRLRKQWTNSAKIEKTIELLSEIQANDATEKTLIFSQFTSLLDLLEVPLQDHNFRYQRYDGSMKLDDRADVVNKFMDDPNEKVMLISLKAGNAGLNLNKASQVIILDPFWNPFIEDQAVDRAHRMPQQREVHVHRLLVPETVEDRICALQDKKRELISAALDEKAGKSLSKLSVRNLMFLFGLSRERGD